MLKVFSWLILSLLTLLQYFSQSWFFQQIKFFTTYLWNSLLFKADFAFLKGVFGYLMSCSHRLTLNCGKFNHEVYLIMQTIKCSVGMIIKSLFWNSNLNLLYDSNAIDNSKVQQLVFLHEHLAAACSYVL